MLNGCQFSQYPSQQLSRKQPLIKATGWQPCDQLVDSCLAEVDLSGSSPDLYSDGFHGSLNQGLITKALFHVTVAFFQSVLLPLALLIHPSIPDWQHQDQNGASLGTLKAELEKTDKLQGAEKPAKPGLIPTKSLPVDGNPMILPASARPQSFCLSSKPPQKIEGFASHPQLRWSAAAQSPDCHRPLLRGFAWRSLRACDSLEGSLVVYSLIAAFSQLHSAYTVGWSHPAPLQEDGEGPKVQQPDDTGPVV